MPRILSTDGNVIAADFRPRVLFTIEIRTRILYLDDRICLSRVTYTAGGKPMSKLPMQHFLADLATGELHVF